MYLFQDVFQVTSRFFQRLRVDVVNGIGGRSDLVEIVSNPAECKQQFWIIYRRGFPDSSVCNQMSEKYLTGIAGFLSLFFQISIFFICHANPYPFVSFSHIFLLELYFFRIGVLGACP